MMRLLTILLLASFGTSAQTIKTKGGEVITIKGKDTLVAFAGNWRVYKRLKRHDQVKKRATIPKRTKTDIFWDEVAIRKQQEYADKAVQVHGATRFVKSAAKKTTVKKK